ncbi:DNA topoisomerase III [Magnetococcus marinus MC-1]|uniref:DNA topoisomerase n=1 Tax=Magnetococcus marinus (strain ATCC BAA-1437 / JCM 17883 / MC-1) TaxID=156889 RepID=A0LAP8_MAGMM|nr:DNA topoisomerase III [Magnetococcus marinus]ABK45041.1 DNA topoisomerase III [Magnetococcus marinus MC-1]
MILYLCEKPSQGRDIGRVLGATSRHEGYVAGAGVCVTWCIGHLMEMVAPDGYRPEWKSWRLDTLPIIPQQWQLELTARGRKQFKVIQGLLKGVTEVVLATDADREGETIGREVLERCQYRGKISRLWLSALDDASIRKALGNLLPGEQTEPLYQAGLGRSRADWMVGMNLTRAYTLLGRQGGYAGVLSVGRVQTPTLKLVVDRDRLIENFKPVDYFEIFALHRVHSGTFIAKWVPPPKPCDAEGHCLDRTLAETVIHKVQGHSGTITKAETKRVKEPPPLPLELSTLQQEASRRWGMGAKQTLEIAQSLYEKHKAVTYPRTDCRYLPSNQFKEAPAVLQGLTTNDASLTPLVEGADAQLRSKAWNDKKITAHHAIIPTAAKINIDALSREEALLYDLIRRHYLAQFYPPFEYDRTVIDTQVAMETFHATGRVELIPGWKRVLAANQEKKEGDEDEQTLPVVRSGEAATIEGAELKQKQTKPPNRYTEGTLIQAMKSVGKLVEDARLRKILRETSGIGTEATRAAILETLIKRNLLAKQGKKSLVSMPAGRLLVDALPHSVTDPATTAVWEQTLDDIAHGGGSLETFLAKSELWLNKLIHNVHQRQQLGLNPFRGLPPSTSHTDPAQPTPRRQRRSKAEVTPTPNAAPLCPQCGGPMLQRKSPQGAFWSCAEQATCTGTRPGSPLAAHSPLMQPNPERGPLCPKCQQAPLVQRTAYRGKNSGQPFWGCQRYPQCRYTQASQTTES